MVALLGLRRGLAGCLWPLLAHPQVTLMGWGKWPGWQMGRLPGLWPREGQVGWGEHVAEIGGS